MGSTLARVIFSQIHGEPLYLWLTRILDGGCDDEVARVSGAKPDGNPLHRLYDSEEHTHTCDRGSISHMMCSIAPTKSSANIPNAPDGLKMPWSTFNPLRASRPLECSTVLIGTWWRTGPLLTSAALTGSSASNWREGFRRFVSSSRIGTRWSPEVRPWCPKTLRIGWRLWRTISSKSNRLEMQMSISFVGSFTIGPTNIASRSVGPWSRRWNPGRGCWFRTSYYRSREPCPDSWRERCGEFAFQLWSWKVDSLLTRVLSEQPTWAWWGWQTQKSEIGTIGSNC